MQMLYFYPRKLTPVFKLFFGSFFDKEADETFFSKEPKRLLIKVVPSIAPNDPINFTKKSCKFIKESPVRGEKDSISSITTSDI